MSTPTQPSAPPARRQGAVGGSRLPVPKGVAAATMLATTASAAAPTAATASIATAPPSATAPAAAPATAAAARKVVSKKPSSTSMPRSSTTAARATNAASTAASRPAAAAGVAAPRPRPNSGNYTGAITTASAPAPRRPTAAPAASTTVSSAAAVPRRAGPGPAGRARPPPNPTFARGFARFDNGDAARSAAKSLAKIIRQSRATGRLNLSSQSLTEVPEAVFTQAGSDGGEEARGAAEVNLSWDRDDDAGVNWWEEVELQRLVLADNQLAVLDGRVASFQALVSLDVHGNQLTALPDLSPLANLTVLNVSSNRLTALPATLSALPLSELLAADNEISSIADGVLPLHTLQILRLARNRLTALPSRLFAAAPRLTDLDVASNQLETLPVAPEGATSGTTCPLESLDASHNRLRDLGAVAGLARLRSLAAAENRIEVLFPCTTAASAAAAVALPNLERLDVRVNRLRALGGGSEGGSGSGSTATTAGRAVSVPRLRELLASGNSLDLPGVEATLLLADAEGALETLDVRDNSLAGVPAAVGRMPRLARIFVEGNPIRAPRRAVVERGSGAIIRYMRERVAAAVEEGGEGGEGGGSGAASPLGRAE